MAGRLRAAGAPSGDRGCGQSIGLDAGQVPAWEGGGRGHGERLGRRTQPVF